MRTYTSNRVFQFALAFLMLGSISTAFAQSTAFTYNGRLNFNGTPVNGSYDFQFTIYDTGAGGNVVAGPLSINALNVTEGLFVTRLDFGPGVFTGPARWIQISVRSSGNGNFATLDQRLELTSSPYSIRAQAAGVADSIAAGSAVKSFNGLHDDVTLAPGTNVTFTFNGNTVTIAAAGAGGSGIWSVNGNNAYYTAGNVGIGIVDPAEELTIAGVPNYNNGLKLTGNASGGTGLALENTSSGGHKYALFSAGSGDAVGTGGFGVYDDTAGAYRIAIAQTGSVGIGTASPKGGLEIHWPWDGQDYGALTLSGIYPTLRFTGDLLTDNMSWLMQLSPNGGNLEFYNKIPTGAWTLSMAISPNGYVGIGTPDPFENLSIAGVASYNSGLKLSGSTTAGTGLALENTAGGGHKYALLSGGSATGVGAGGFGIYDDTVGAYRLSIDASGNVGIGKRNAQFALDVAGDLSGTRLILRADPLATANAAVLCADPNVANFVPFNTAIGQPLNIIVRDATVRQLTITGGADFAEPFAMSNEKVSPGSVVVIDEKSPGRLTLSTQAYDKRVAGVVSGANGIRPGISLHQEGAIEGSENVALSGRVYVQADAEFGAIRPGDLLTTSDTPGHAMKVIDHTKAQGAILGKAMSGLTEGKGLVLVLVTLQ